MPHVLLLDTSSLAYRAFFALPASIADEDGRPVNAVRGYLDMTARLIVDREPDRVVHTLDDDWRPGARVAAYAGYKADRPPDPDGLPEQFDLLRRVLGLVGQDVAYAPGWEADDAIGALCHRAGQGDWIDIVTGDRDLLQLVRDGDGDHAAIRVLFTVRGVSELGIFDAGAVREKYGVPPERYTDFAILRGDPSDGLPGIKGVGEKTARGLVHAATSLAELVERAAEQTPRVAAALRDGADYLAAMGEVVPVRHDVEVVFDDAEPDVDAARALAARHNFEAPLRRLLGAIGDPG